MNPRCGLVAIVGHVAFRCSMGTFLLVEICWYFSLLTQDTTLPTGKLAQASCLETPWDNEQFPVRTSVSNCQYTQKSDYIILILLNFFHQLKTYILDLISSKNCQKYILMSLNDKKLRSNFVFLKNFELLLH